MLKIIGLKRNWIYEVIISTYRGDTPYSAPIGIWTEDFSTVCMELYKTTQTLKNIMEMREFAVNLVSEMKIFYESLFRKERVSYTQSSDVNAPVIDGTHTVIECKLKDAVEKQKTFDLISVPVHAQTSGNPCLINRAKSLALESLILTTKLPHRPRSEIEATLQENYRVIKKVAPDSEYESILQALMERISSGAQSH